jgi:hypothetical protein
LPLWQFCDTDDPSSVQKIATWGNGGTPNYIKIPASIAIRSLIEFVNCA